MASLYRIPIGQNAAWYEFNITLDGQKYLFEMRYNVRDARWRLTISDAAGNVVLSGIKLVVARNLTGQYTTLALPPGTLFAVDRSGQDLQPGLSSFLSDHALYYAEPA